jgi:hypothetical protein
MKPENWIALVTGVVNLILTATGLYLGPKLAVKRALEQFHSQKWWEKQEQTYTCLLERLSWLKAQNIRYMDSEERGTHYSATDNESKTAQEARQYIEMSVEHGSYLISEPAAKALRATLYVHGDWPMDHYDLYHDKLEAAISIIRAEANSKVKPNRH